MEEEERADPDLLSKSASRRRRVAQASGHAEGEVTTMMAAFTQMRTQMTRMSMMMKLNTAEGQQDQKLLQDLVESAGKKVADGKVRRKKEVLKPKGLGFGAPTVTKT